MPFATTDKSLSHMARMMPADAFAAWCAAANAAEAQGLSGNDVIRKAWDVLHADWHRPNPRKPYRRRRHEAIQLDGGSNSPYTAETTEAPRVARSTAKTLKLQVVKLDEEQRMFYAWAYVTTKNGEPYEDSQGDTIDTAELEKASTDFMVDARLGLVMHERDGDGKVDPSMRKALIVHSMPITKEILKALGLQCDREGWIIGGKVLDDQAWEDVKAGELPAISIGGDAEFEPLEDAA